MFLSADVSITYRKIGEKWKINIPASFESLISALILDYRIIGDLFRQDIKKGDVTFQISRRIFLYFSTRTKTHRSLPVFNLLFKIASQFKRRRMIKKEEER